MKPSVSLVLSSGGARGVAHIGVIEELERQGFEIKSIAGSSISIPTVFKPYSIEDMLLIDGGVLNPIPINRVRRNKGDILIAVDVNAPYFPEKKAVDKKLSIDDADLSYFSFLMKKGFQFLPKITERQLNYYSLLSQTASLMIQQISALTIEMCKPDILINIPMNSYGPFLFYKSEEIIKAGELATRKAITQTEGG